MPTPPTTTTVTPMELKMTGAQLQARRTNLKLTQLHVARLLRMQVTPDQRLIRRGDDSKQVGKWENDRAQIPPGMVELLETKLYLLERGAVTFEKLTESPLHVLLVELYRLDVHIGNSLRLTNVQIRALRDTADLTQVQIAVLLHMKISRRKGKGSQQAVRVGAWESGRDPIPESSAELLQAKLCLLKAGVTTYDRLLEHPLHAVILELLKR